MALSAERTKTGGPHEVPLSDQAIAVLEALPRIAGSDFVLTSDTGTSPLSSFSKGKCQLDALLPGTLPQWRLHDLRAGMARLRVPLPDIEKVLNHTSGSFAGIVGVYQLRDFADEKLKRSL